MPDHTELKEAVARVARAAGLQRIGVAAADPFDATRHEMERRHADGLSAKLRFTYKDPSLATDVRHSFPWAERLIVGVRSYLPEAGTAESRPLHGRIARFAVEDPYVPLRGGLEKIADLLAADGHRAEVLVDDDRLVDRAAAIRAGVAWWGKSTMALTPGLGPWFVIGSVVTDAVLDVDEPMARTCGTCDACLPACPTGALTGPGVLDARKCLAALAQSPGVIPRQWRRAMADRLYGCDDCLDACPPGNQLRIRSTADRGSVSLRAILESADETLLHRFEHFYLPNRSPRFLRRNALVAAGNDGDPSLVDVVAIHAGHPDWLLRAHAIWALGRLGGHRARAVLLDRSERERHPEVRHELDLALADV